MDREDRVLRGFARHATVPVINLETITHPCQELAHVLALQERFGADLRGRKYVLTWTYHPKPLNTAVANSALTIATRMGMDVTLLCPTADYLLDQRYMEIGARQCRRKAAARCAISHDIDDGLSPAPTSSTPRAGARCRTSATGTGDSPIREQLKHFIVDEAKMALTNHGVFSHCLPLRRNVKATDAVMDSPACIAIDEAENRLHVQKAVMAALVGAAANELEGSAP